MTERQHRRARWRYRLLAPFYDVSNRFNHRLREDAVRRLNLAPGDVVLDVGCGTGLSFEPIERTVGPEGRIIGVELTPAMLARARDRAAVNGWQNVTLIEGAAEDAAMPTEVDAALLFYVHDILQSDVGLSNVLSALKPGARVAAAGPKRPARWWQLPANLLVPAFTPFITTTEGVTRPWARLERLLPELRVEERPFGIAYLAYGTKK